MRYWPNLLIVLFVCLSACKGSDSANQASAIKALRAAEGQNLAKVAGVPLPSCEAWCDPDNPDFRCFFAGGLQNGRDKQFAQLIKRLEGTGKVTLPHNELLAIFDERDPRAKGLRGDTVIENGELSNGGTPTVAEAETVGALKISLMTPSALSYSHSRRQTGFTLEERANSSSFDIILDDKVLQATYGGRVRKIDADEKRAVLYTANGCISYDPSANLNSATLKKHFVKMTAARLLAERAAGANASRIYQVNQSYMKLGALRNAECDIYGEQCHQCPAGQIACKIGHHNNCMTRQECRDNGGELCSGS